MNLLPYGFFPYGFFIDLFFIKIQINQMEVIYEKNHFDRSLCRASCGHTGGGAWQLPARSESGGGG
jgi:hypothetical protein